MPLFFKEVVGSKIKVGSHNTPNNNDCWLANEFY
jgi:hypothetical protein